MKPHNFLSTQLGLFEQASLLPNREIVHPGLTASEAVARLYEMHEIKQFTFTTYWPESTYPLGKNQPYYWQPWQGQEQLQQLSEQVRLESTWEMEFEGETLVFSDFFAVASRVKTTDGWRQMMMLDFNYTDETDPIDIGIASLLLPPGVLLQTDHSFHYYGFDLLKDEDWLYWMDRLLMCEETRRLLGEEYLRMCLQRGYTALRVFGYPGTGKEKDPVMVAYTGQ